jgi:hypothetical protein
VYASLCVCVSLSVYGLQTSVMKRPTPEFDCCAAEDKGIRVYQYVCM